MEFGACWTPGRIHVVQAPCRAPDNEDSTIYNINPAAFKGRSYRELLDDMTEGTQRFLVWVISQPSPSGALADFAAYLNKRRAENDGDDNTYWIGKKHKGRSYRQIYTRDPDYVDWVQEVAQSKEVGDELWDFALYTFNKDGVNPPERILREPSPEAEHTLMLGDVPDMLMLSAPETQLRQEAAESRTQDRGSGGDSPQAGRGFTNELKMEQQAEGDDEEEEEDEEEVWHSEDETAASPARSEGQATADMPGGQSYSRRRGRSPMTTVKEEEEEESTGGSETSRMAAALRAEISGSRRTGTQVKDETEEEGVEEEDEEEESEGDEEADEEERLAREMAEAEAEGDEDFSDSDGEEKIGDKTSRKRRASTGRRHKVLSRSSSDEEERLAREMAEAEAEGDEDFSDSDGGVEAGDKRTRKRRANTRSSKKGKVPSQPKRKRRKA